MQHKIYHTNICLNCPHICGGFHYSLPFENVQFCFNLFKSYFAQSRKSAKFCKTHVDNVSLSGNLCNCTVWLKCFCAAFVCCVFVYLCICVFVYLCICVFVYLYICVSVSQSSVVLLCPRLFRSVEMLFVFVSPSDQEHFKLPPHLVLSDKTMLPCGRVGV